MKKDDRDSIDDLFRSKLYDFEVETSPDDWAAIEGRLNRPSIPLYRKTWFQSAAAVAILAILTISALLNVEDEELNRLAEKAEQQQVVQTQAEQNWMAEEKSEELDRNVYIENTKTAAVPSRNLLSYSVGQTKDVKEAAVVMSVSDEVEAEESAPKEKEEVSVNEEQPVTRAAEVVLKDRNKVQQSSPVKAERKKKSSGWRLGMGAGSFSAGNSSSVNAFALRSSVVSNDYLTLMNATSAWDQTPKTDTKHREPFSFGISVSKALSDRWSFQTGLTYSYLKSEWTTNKTYRAESVQRLHFLGIPAAMTFKIAEWNKLMFYASAGGKVELNVAGKTRTDLFTPAEKLKSVTEHTRMKEPYFSVDGRVGVSYPVWRFLSAYAEVGADYYFDNGSDMETIHSEKPFKVGFQFGLRLGF